jgi:hypothetical protein
MRLPKSMGHEIRESVSRYLHLRQIPESKTMNREYVIADLIAAGLTLSLCLYPLVYDWAVSLKEKCR